MNPKKVGCRNQDRKQADLSKQAHISNIRVDTRSARAPEGNSKTIAATDQAESKTDNSIGETPRSTIRIAYVAYIGASSRTNRYAR